MNSLTMYKDLVDIRSEFNSLSIFKKESGESNDYNRIVRAINSTPVGGKLIIPQGTYDLGGNNLTIAKEIKIDCFGIHSSEFQNGGIIIKSNNVEINGLFVNCPNLNNGFECNSGAYSNIKITNCKSIAKQHSYLFESYNGTVTDVVIENCESAGSIHGFISKATNVKFIGCKAVRHTSGFGFGVISDNILGTSNTANAIGNIVENCEAISCTYGYISYCRDKFNTTCVPVCSNNSINNFIANGCMYPVSIGEDEIADGYVSNGEVKFTNINNVSDMGTLQTRFAIRMGSSYKCVINNSITLGGVIQSSNARDNFIGNVSAENKCLMHTSAFNLITSTCVLNVAMNNCFEIFISNNTLDTDTISFTGLPRNGSIVTVMTRNAGKGTFGGFDTNTMQIDTTKFTILNSGLLFNNAQVTQWMYCPGLSKKWVCIYASEVIKLA